MRNILPALMCLSMVVFFVSGSVLAQGPCLTYEKRTIRPDGTLEVYPQGADPKKIQQLLRDVAQGVPHCTPISELPRAGDTFYRVHRQDASGPCPLMRLAIFYKKADEIQRTVDDTIYIKPQVLLLLLNVEGRVCPKNIPK